MVSVTTRFSLLLPRWRLTLPPRSCTVAGGCCKRRALISSLHANRRLHTTSESSRHSMVINSTSAITISEPQRSRIDEMASALALQDTKEGKLSQAMKICSFTKQHSIKPWLLGEGVVKEFYEVLSSEMRSSNVEDVIALMKSLHPRDPIMESMAKVLSRRQGELDFHGCIYLAHLSLQVPRLGAILRPVVAVLAQHLVRLMAADADLGGTELVRSLSLLVTLRHYSKEMSDIVGGYLGRHLYRMDLESVCGLLDATARGVAFHGIHCMPEYTEAVCAYLLRLLHRPASVEDRGRCWGKSYGLNLSQFLCFLGRVQCYSEEVCERVKELFLSPYDAEIHNPVFMSGLAYMCSQVCYYDECLLEYIMQLACNQVESFHVKELSDLLVAFQNLNFHHGLFLSKVIQVTLRSSLLVPQCELYWTIINSSIFMNDYDSEVLARFLTDSMMEASIDEGKFSPHIYLKLLIGLAVENPQLGHGSALITEQQQLDLKFGQVPYRLAALSDKYTQHSLQAMLNWYKKKSFSMFGSNFHRALKEVVGNGRFRSEPISLSGYNFDFEVLFGSDGQPLEVASSCVALKSAFKSIGLVVDPKSVPDVVKPSRMAAALLLRDIDSHALQGGSRSGADHLRAKEGSDVQAVAEEEEEEEGEVLKGMKHAAGKTGYVRLASDWASYFVPLGSSSEPRPSLSPSPSPAHGSGQVIQDAQGGLAVRKVVFELNGPYHYARNTRSAPGHMRGKDSVKKRQLEALGWEVVHVPHYEWNSLKNGDTQIKYVQYIIEKLRSLN